MNAVRYVRKFWRSSSFFVASLFSLLLLMVIGLVMYYLSIASNDTLFKETEAAIDSEIRLFQEAGTAHGMEHVRDLLSRRLQDPANSYVYALLRPDDSIAIGNLTRWPVIQEESAKPGIIYFEIPHEQLTLPTLSLRAMSKHYDIMAKLHSFDDGGRLLVGRNIDDLEIAQWVTLRFGWVVVGIVLLVGMGCFLIGSFVVNKINSISKTASDIMHTGNIAKRIPGDSSWDDLSRLIKVLNRMLDEIEALVLNTKRVTDNIAHDLRTPLTRLHTDLAKVRDMTLREDLTREVDNLLAMFNGLLRIAEIETEHKTSGFTALALHEIVEDAEALYRPLAEEKQITITCNTVPCPFFGDRDLLFQAFANIIDNAIKFTPKGKHIAVTLARKEDGILFTVEDSGPGIDKAKQEQVFERFYREEKSRSSPGHGLGLSIVKAVIHLHRGKISFINIPSGMRCEVVLPQLMR
jgi:signal transduction histidine kinase